MLSEAGELEHVNELTFTLPSLPSTLFAVQSAADLVAELDKVLSDNPRWQWRASTHERDIVNPEGVRVAARVSTVVHYFGFKGGNFHKIIDPVVMYGKKLDEVWPGDAEITQLLDWAKALRDFCDKNGMDVRPTLGGMSAQFLTDRRFYPKRRRKVPATTNQRARDELPGNHYLLTVYPTPHREFTGLYLDQHRAHHYHARTTPLPDSNQLYAYGRFIDLAEITFENTWPDFHGLYCLDLQSPGKYRRSHWLHKLERAFVFSNELQHLVDMGYIVNGVYAAWGSFKRDTGLAKYARWASKQLDHYGDRPWLKPLLLATYGTLATKPRYGEAVFKLAKDGELVTLPTGRHSLTGHYVKASRKLEPRIANVLHRGMIEAATRSESVGYAQHLTTLGHRVLSIYADAVIIEEDCEKPGPPIIEPWRLKTTLNHLQFINQQAFLSGEMTKLPGVSRELMAYRQHTTPGHSPDKFLSRHIDPLTGERQELRRI